MRLIPTRHRKDGIRIKSRRGEASWGVVAFVGTESMQRVHFFIAASPSIVRQEALGKIDTKTLARQLEVDSCEIDVGRSWTMDEMEFRGDIVELQGVRMISAGDMTAETRKAYTGAPYCAALIHRNTDWIYYARKPLYLLREPDGTVWTMQEFANAIDPSLCVENLHELGGKLKNLPDGWSFESVVLAGNLSLDTRRADGWAAVLCDELGCIYQSCGRGFDASSNYVL